MALPRAAAPGAVVVPVVTAAPARVELPMQSQYQRSDSRKRSAESSPTALRDVL